MRFQLSSLVMAGLLAATPLAAQNSAAPLAPDTTASAPVAASPRALDVVATTGPVAVTRQQAVQTQAIPAFQRSANLGTSRAMMLVGVAALVTGAIIGGDVGTIFMAGGAVVGLYGLYKYLQ